MRSAQDLKVLQKPPWLNASRLWRLVSAMALLLGTAAVWVWTLRKEVNRKRALIEHQTSQVAVMRERTRIARDLHDTVEQGLTGLSLQLKSLEMSPHNLPEKIRNGLRLALRILGNTRAVTHYAVQELREGSLMPETLKTGLERTAKFWSRTGAVTVHLRFPEEMPPLPKTLEVSLLAIAREAMTNAVKHGQATAIAIEAELNHEKISLRVKDNGCGFELHGAAGSESGHFGIQGMRERIEEANGHLEIHSHPGEGTTVEMNVPFKPSGSFDPRKRAARSGGTPAESPALSEPPSL
jgi:signal transduction histidine kinase